MNRRVFLQLLLLAPFALYLRTRPAQAAEPYDSSGGWWVFDGVNGLTFPATTARGCLLGVTGIYSFRALSFLERLFGGGQ